MRRNLEHIDIALKAFWSKRLKDIPISGQEEIYKIALENKNYSTARIIKACIDEGESEQTQF